MRLQLADVEVGEKHVRGLVEGLVGDDVRVRKRLLVGLSVDEEVPALGGVVCVATGGGGDRQLSTYTYLMTRTGTNGIFKTSNGSAATPVSLRPSWDLILLADGIF